MEVSESGVAVRCKLSLPPDGRSGDREWVLSIDIIGGAGVSIGRTSKDLDLVFSLIFRLE